MKSNIILQDVFLNQVRRDQTQVCAQLTNGQQIDGMVKGFDSFTVILDVQGKQVMVYKHAISTITPAKPVYFNFSADRRGNSEDYRG